MDIDFQFTYELPDGTDIEVDATCNPGRDMIQPSMSGPGEPAESDEININETTIYDQPIELEDLWIKLFNGTFISVEEEIQEKAVQAWADQSADV